MFIARTFVIVLWKSLITFYPIGQVVLAHFVTAMYRQFVTLVTAVSRYSIFKVKAKIYPYTICLKKGILRSVFFIKNEKVNKMFTLFRNIVYKNFPLIHPSTIRPTSGILRSGFWENSNILIKKLKNVFRKLTLTLYAKKWVFCGVVLQKFTYIFYSG